MRTNRHPPGNMAVLVNAPRTGLRTLEDVVEAAAAAATSRCSRRYGGSKQNRRSRPAAALLGRDAELLDLRSPIGEFAVEPRAETPCRPTCRARRRR